ncbi:MAG: response regulator transcription factor [Acidimicrobiales bacterium]|nr:response regulator transcription factor [Acidimicrobiales bacterium]HLV90952.1 response regulator transcription factor [Acidimicrobiia bacterium]
MPTVLIVDDAELFREALRAAFVQEGFKVVAVAADAMSAIDRARESQPDLVILDLLMPGMSGIEVLGTILKVSPRSRVVLLTSSESSSDLMAAVKGGASGYLTKDTPLPRLVAAMNDVLDGGAAISPAMGGKLFGVLRELLRHNGASLNRRSPELTGRELEVLAMVADGKTSREIADELYISENTVRNHVRNILEKLGMSSRFEAVNWAYREGLIEAR